MCVSGDRSQLANHLPVDDENRLKITATMRLFHWRQRNAPNQRHLLEEDDKVGDNSLRKGSLKECDIVSFVVVSDCHETLLKMTATTRLFHWQYWNVQECRPCPANRDKVGNGSLRKGV
jgi:hypothetical protein